jgi:hypothetical protein
MRDRVEVGSWSCRVLFTSKTSKIRIQSQDFGSSRGRCGKCGVCIPIGKCHVRVPVGMDNYINRPQHSPQFPTIQTNPKAATMHLTILFAQLLLLILPINAQFQFFEQMFGGGGGGHPGHQHQPQNMPSDSGWYQQQYENGMTIFQATGFL